MLQLNSQLLTRFETGSTHFKTNQPVSKPWSACSENSQRRCEAGSHIALVAMHSPVISVNPIYRVDNRADDLEVFLSQITFPLDTQVATPRRSEYLRCQHP